MATSQVVITDAEAVGVIEKYSAAAGLSKAEGGAKLIGVARSRINALRKYAAKQAGNGTIAAKPAKKAAKEVKAAKPKAAAKAPKVTKAAKKPAAVEAF